MFSSGRPEHVKEPHGNRECLIVVFASLDRGISELAVVASLYTYLA